MTDQTFLGTPLQLFGVYQMSQYYLFYVFHAVVIPYCLNRIPEDTVVRLKEAQEKEAVMLENIGELKSR
mgnify:CR=1 FL=1